MATHKSYIGSGKEYVRYTDEELAEVRRTDMVDFLGRKEGFSFKRVGNYYKCIEHNSLVIYPNHQMWVWNSQNLKGLNCIDWLQKVNGYSFQEACSQMIHLDKSEQTSFKKATAEIKSNEPAPLIIPEKTDGNYKNVYMYLTKTRCIDKDIVTYCFHNKLIYQEKEYKNAVFVGYDEENNIKFVEKRGTNPAYKFRGNVEGIDPRYSFNITCDKSLSDADIHRVYVFEAPIDLLSHCTLTKIADKVKHGENADPNCWKKQNRLSLSGTADVALEAYLQRNPDITEINCCLDNDDAGIKAANIIKEKYSDRYKVVIHRVKNCKDYNEALQNYCKASCLSETNLGENKTREGDVSYIHSVKR